MVEFVIDNIDVKCYGRVYQQTVGILMGTNCSSHIKLLLYHIYKRVNSRNKNPNKNPNV